MMKKFNSLGLSTKIITATMVILLAVVAVNYVVFLRGYAADTQDALMDKAAAFTAVADETKNLTSLMHSQNAFDEERLLEEALAHVAKHGKDSYSETEFFTTIPVVAGWTAAGEAADREGINFDVLAFEARNKKNEPAPGTFEHALLTDLTSQVKAGGEEVLGRVNSETNTLHYVRAIKLDQSCMMCHGDPATSPNGDGKDALGFPMENWKPGYQHGAYHVSMPLDAMDAQIAGFFQRGLMFTVPIVIGSALLFIFALRAMLTRPVTKLVDMMRETATGDGDLTVRLNLDRGDEIGKLAHWFDVFMENLHGLIGQVKSTTEEVAGASTQIAASAEEMSAGMSNQEQQTSQVSAAVEEMSATVMEVAKKSADAAAAAESSGNEATEGGQVVSKTVAEMEGISEQVNVSAQAVSELGRKGEQIGEIIGVINDIADQTNLLALNAAIEAARAGEHGRGFAVVADEVRKLAERTTQATEEVAKSIREIQDETGTAVEQISAGTERVKTGVDLANSAGSALERIVGASRNLQGMVQSIAAASEEQSAASEQIARSVEQISAVTRESSEGARQASEAAAQMSQQAEKLRSLVGRFKL